MNVFYAAASLASPFVLAIASFVIKRALQKQDMERAEQTAMIKTIAAQMSEMVRDFARLQVTVSYHDMELKRFRELVDRWNEGPGRAQ